MDFESKFNSAFIELDKAISLLNIKKKKFTDALTEYENDDIIFYNTKNKIEFNETKEKLHKNLSIAKSELLDAICKEALAELTVENLKKK